MGNRTGKSDMAGSTTTTTAYAYDAANRLTSTAANGASASAVTSDAGGNTLTDTSGRTNTWDSQNRLTSCTKGGVTSTFTYGADGLRRSSTVNNITTYYVYDGTMLIREMHKNVQTGALYNTATYLQGPRGPEYRRDDTQQELDSQGRQVSVCRWYVYDGLGSVVGEVDASGNLTSSPKYDVYGLVRSNPGSASSRQGFVGSLGHVSDTETGLIYMRARYYDPSLGRFESEDDGKDGNNWFAYVANNPVSEADSTGKAAQWWNYATYGLGLMFTALAVTEATSISYYKTIEGAVAAAESVKALSEAAIVCFAVSMVGIGSAAQEALNVVMMGAFSLLLNQVVGGVIASGAVNYPGVDVAVGAVLTESLVCIALLATDNGDY